MNDHEKIIQEFLIESSEGLDRMNACLLSLEKGNDPDKNIGNIFRAVHTIKGTCGFLGFKQLEKLSHAAETLLDKMRNAKIAPTLEVINTLLVTCDQIRQCLSIVQSHQSDSLFESVELINILEKLATQEASVVLKKNSPDAQEIALDPHGAFTDNTIRLDIHLLDKLMNLVGELVLARNKILQVSTVLPDVGLASSSQHLNLITTELQETVMQTRLQPINNVWHIFPRVVRDLSLACHKSIEVKMQGEDTELDKTIIEAIKDPLTHLIRNAVDHGIEIPEVRTSAGKPESGTIFLKAFHEGGQVNIEVTDDGRGIDLEKIIHKLKQNALLPADTIDKMSERDLIMMIFTAGFSTASQITNISGRGVGMDVVKTNIEKIGGSVDASTRKGLGTTFKIKIPLTLAIIPALIVKCGGQHYAIPQVNLTELVRIDTHQSEFSIEYIHNAPVYRLRGKLLPLVYLKNVLGIHEDSPDILTSATNIIVLKSLDKTFGLVVDEISDTQEIVVKPLAKELKSTREFSGATITGNGLVTLILDVLGIAQSVNISQAVSDSNIDFNEILEGGSTISQSDSLIYFQVGGNVRMAMPLSDVARLEEFPISKIQNASGREVVDYRGHILPLVRLIDLYPAGQSGTSNATHLSVIVHQSSGKQVGFVVDRILDISESKIISTDESPIVGIKYSALVDEYITDILDTQKAIEKFLPDCLSTIPTGDQS